MISEILDKESGAILFKKDPDSLRYEELLAKVRSYEKQIKSLEKRIAALEKSK